ncbi:MAG: D-arabinono-1,4-lactone oxidase [Caldilineaceae bacterium]
MAEWSNWSASVQCAPTAIIEPQSEAELVAAVRQSASTIRVRGTGHSFVPLCAADGLLISLDQYQGVVAADASAMTATVRAGAKIHQLGAPLLEAGLAMANMGDIDRQSIAGAISTGTHGTGRTLGSISTQVAALRLITASGDVVDCSPAQEPDIFRAAQVSLGALGIISQVTLRLLPAYRLHEKTWAEPFDECVARLGERIAQNRHFEFFWVPAHDVCAIKTLNMTDLSALPQPAAKTAVEGRLARYIGEERIDWSYRIFPSERNLKFNETEFALSAQHGPQCLAELRTLMQTQYPDVAWPIEYRTLAADDIWLSPAYGRDTVTISVHQAAELPYRPFFDDVEAIFRNYGGRPHWGKIHTHRAAELAALYPQWQAFQKVRRQLDPRGRFLNEYLRQLLDG